MSGGFTVSKDFATTKFPTINSSLYHFCDLNVLKHNPVELFKLVLMLCGASLMNWDSLNYL